jgi:hypothetical protein
MRPMEWPEELALERAKLMPLAQGRQLVQVWPQIMIDPAPTQSGQRTPVPL